MSGYRAGSCNTQIWVSIFVFFCKQIDLVCFIFDKYFLSMANIFKIFSFKFFKGDLPKIDTYFLFCQMKWFASALGYPMDISSCFGRAWVVLYYKILPKAGGYRANPNTSLTRTSMICWGDWQFSLIFLNFIAKSK